MGLGIEDLAIGDIEPLQESLDFLEEDYWEASDHPLYNWAAFILEEMLSKVWNQWSPVVAMQPGCLGALQLLEILVFGKALDEIAHISVLGGALDFYV